MSLAWPNFAAGKIAIGHHADQPVIFAHHCSADILVAHLHGDFADRCSQRNPDDILCITALTCMTLPPRKICTGKPTAADGASIARI